MIDNPLRSRVERLLGYDFRADDLTRLFLYARDRCDGRESVQEIGDFVAHHHERTKGIITRTTRDWFHIVRFQMPRFGPGGPFPIDWYKLPAGTPEYLGATMRRISHEIVKRNTGISRTDAVDVLRGILKKLILNADGTHALSPTFNRHEQSLFRTLCSHIVVQPAFSADRLHEDFQATLRSHGLLKRDEFRTFKQLLPAIALFAVSVMHRCAIKIADGIVYPLQGQPGGGGAITVNASIPLEREPNLFISAGIFSTDLNGADYCEPDLFASPNWDFEIEVNSGKKLARLR